MENLLNKIHHADCLDFMCQMPDKCVDLVLTDPPYGTTACSWDSIIPFNAMWVELDRIRKDKCAVALFGQEPFSSLLRTSNLHKFKYDWIWEKQKASNFMSMKHQPAKYHEIISVFYPHDYFPVMWMIDDKKRDKRKTVTDPMTNKDCHLGSIKRTRSVDTGLRYPKSILKIKKSINGNIHPTQKPVELYEYLIRTYTKEGDIVLDFTSGSGTNAIACYNLNRQFICVEKDSDYYQKSIIRLEEHKKQPTFFTKEPVNQTKQDSLFKEVA